MRTALATVLAVLATAPAAAAEQRSLTLLSTSSEPGFAELADVSDDGARVFIRTDARLIPDDTDVNADLYLRTASGAFVPVTDNALGPDTDHEIFLDAATRDGTVVLFGTTDRLAASDTDDSRDVYRWSAGSVVHVSDGPGPDAEQDAFSGGMSADGTSVVFMTPEALTTSDTDGELDVYRHTAAGELVHVSDGPHGPDRNAPATFNGGAKGFERILFNTTESLADTDTDTSTDIYELGPEGLSHVSDGPAGADPELPARVERLSRDGASVYLATREKLTGTDTDLAEDLYERRSNGILRHVSDNPAGPDGPHAAIFGGASEDGARVWFSSDERLAATDTDSRHDGYLWLESGDLAHVTRNPTGPEAELDAELAGSAADGRLLYLETAEALAPTDLDAKEDVYEYGSSGGLRHISDGPGSDAEMESYFTAASDDGSRVLFETKEQLVAGDTDPASDVYERTPAGALAAVSDSTVGPDQDINAHLGALSRDGTRLYLNAIDPLTAADLDDNRDLYLSTVGPDPPHGGDPPAPPRDATPPRISRLRFVRGRLRFTLSEPADVKIAVRRGRTLRLAGRPAGPNRVRLRVRRGRHRLTITALDAAGNRSTARLRFRSRR